MSVFDVNPSTPTITSNKIRSFTVNFDAATMNNMPTDKVLSGSIVHTEGCGLYKALLIKISSGSATSLGDSGSNYYVDVSYDGTTGWHGVDNTNLSGLTGSITALNVWNYVEISKPLPFIRVLLLNCTGSKISGSVAVIASYV